MASAVLCIVHIPDGHFQMHFMFYVDDSFIIFIHSLCPGGRREGGRPDTEKTRGQAESRQNSAAKETGDCGMSGPRVVLAQTVKC